jgi:hypothetical protein
MAAVIRTVHLHTQKATNNRCGVSELMHPFGSIKHVEHSSSYFNIECEPTIIVDV